MTPEEHAKALLDWTLPHHRLTYLAEDAGDLPGTVDAFGPLTKILLEHPSAPVREGAIYGLAKLGGERVCTMFRHALTLEQNETLRQLLREVLEDDQFRAFVYLCEE